MVLLTHTLPLPCSSVWIRGVGEVGGGQVGGGQEGGGQVGGGQVGGGQVGEGQVGEGQVVAGQVGGGLILIIIEILILFNFFYSLCYPPTQGGKVR